MEAQCAIYGIEKWIGNERTFIYSHALNRKLNQEEHSHEFFEIIYLISGNGRHRVNGKVYIMEAGDVTVLRPGDTHLFIEQSDDLELFSISVVPEEVLRFIEAYHLALYVLDAEEPVLFYLSNSQISTVQNLFHKLSFTQNGDERKAVMNVILGMTMEYYILHRLDQSRDWFQNILFQMRKEENLVEGVPAMMRLAHLSHAHLCRTLKKQGLQPPKYYVKELRLSTAYEMIQNTSMPYEDIALHVGFSSFSHFTTAFKERYGISPAALRRATEFHLL